MTNIEIIDELISKNAAQAAKIKALEKRMEEMYEELNCMDGLQDKVKALEAELEQREIEIGKQSDEISRLLY